MTANTSVHIFFLSVIKKITIKLNQTMWWCATTLWGQSDDYCVVTTACQGQDPALKLTITKISMVVSWTHKHTHRQTLAVACNLLTHWSAFTDVYLLIPLILNSIHHHCQSEGGVCVWVWGWGCHIECWEMCWGMIFRCIKIKKKDSGLRCVVCYWMLRFLEWGHFWKVRKVSLTGILEFETGLEFFMFYDKACNCDSCRG